jgi:large repetitive protein
VTEGSGGTTNAVFSLALSAPNGGTITVDFATADGSATAPTDYFANSGTVTFNPGEVSKQIIVQVVGDIDIESNETFSLNLSNPNNATIAGTGFALATITDNDTPTITIATPVTITEANAGFTTAVFNVSLSAPSGNTVTVAYTTANGSAASPSDYTAQSGVLTFPPGVTGRQIVVQIVGDVFIEANETYSVNLSSPTNATIAGSGFGLGTITNND